MLEILLTLSERYKKFAAGTTSESRISNMLDALVSHCHEWPDDKVGRWVGYVQCLLIEVEHVTTIDAERDFTRPLFHRYYALKGISIPKSYSI